MSDGATGKKRLVLLFDGTWNDIQTSTNIIKLHDSLADKAADGLPQIRRYFEGVGVRPHEKFRGGAFGRYLSQKVREAYDFLVENYRPDDEVFIFGFSRGAFQALMLVGFCHWCGLRKPGADLPVEDLFGRYLDATRSSQEDGHEGSLSRKELLDRQSLSDLSRAVIEATQEMPVKFVGVFDTVRSAGMEALWPRRWRQEREDMLSRRGTLVCRYTRHLPDTVKSAYQALAIDEHRAAFAERVWIVPKGRSGDGSDVYIPTRAEQRWFVGAHANVGGGYKRDDLHRIPLRWMQEKAVRAGLTFTELAEVPKSVTHKHIGLSHGEFAHGTYRWLSKPYNRTVRATEIGRDADHSSVYEGRLHETIDESVMRMILHCRGCYAPQHLRSSLEHISKNSNDDDSRRLAKETLNVLTAF